MTTPEEDAADVLSQVVEIRPTGTRHAAELREAVQRHVSNRPVLGHGPDPETVAALRQLATRELDLQPELSMTPLSVCVDFNDLLETLGEPEVWQVLGKLKDLLG